VTATIVRGVVERGFGSSCTIVDSLSCGVCAAVNGSPWPRGPIEIIMDKQCAHLLQRGRRGAERRFDALMSQLTFLFMSLPHLSDAFDPDGLPLSFLIKRDATDVSVKTSFRQRAARRVVTSRVTRQLRSNGTMRCRGD
jgi:hypothetical protein